MLACKIVNQIYMQTQAQVQEPQVYVGEAQVREIRDVNSNVYSANSPVVVC